MVRRHPAASLLVGALAVSGVLFVPVHRGMLSPAFAQAAALGPSLAAFALVVLEDRPGGVRRLLAGLAIWKVGLGWWLFVLFFPALAAAASHYAHHALGGPPPDLGTLAEIPRLVPLVLLLTILAGVGEELGWRGFALPRLQRRHDALTSSVIVGSIWGLWHIPLFLAEGTVQSQWRSDVGLIVALVGYTVFLMAWSIQMTWVFNHTRGSTLLIAFMHGAGNAWFGSQIDVYRGNWNGIVIFTVVMVATSLAIVAITGRTYLARSGVRHGWDGSGDEA